MAAQSDLKINITLTDKAGKTIKTITQDLENLGKSSNKAGGFMKALTGPVGKATAALAAFSLGAKKAFDLGQAGAAISQTSQSFDMLMSKVGASSDHLDLLRAASRGTVSDMQLMSSTATLLAGAQGELANQLAQATPQLLEIAKAAQKLNPSLGDTTFLYNSLATGVKRASPMILDNLGLTIRLGEANSRYAEALGKTVEQLTADEQKQALLNETLRAGAVLIDQAGGNTDSATDSYDQLEAKISNLTDTLKTNINEGIHPWLVEAGKIIDATQKWVDSLDRSEHELEVQAEMSRLGADQAITWSRNVEIASKQAEEYTKRLAELRMQAEMNVSQEMQEDIIREAEAWKQGTKIIKENNAAILANAQAKAEAEEIERRHANAMGETVTKVEFLTMKQKEASEAYLQAAKELGVNSDEALRLEGVLIQVTESLDAAKDGITATGDAAIVSASKMRAYSISVAEADMVMGLAMDNHEDYIGLLGKASGEWQGTIDVANLWSEIFGEFDDMYQDANEELKTYTSGLSDNTYATNINREAQQLFELQQGKTNQEIIDAENKLRSMTEALNENGAASGITAEMLASQKVVVDNLKDSFNGAASSQSGFIKRQKDMTKATIETWQALGKLGQRMPGTAGGPPPGEDQDPAAWAKKQGYQQGAAGRSAEGHASDVWFDLAKRHKLDLAGGHTEGWAFDFMKSGAGTGLASGFSDSEISAGLEMAKARLQATAQHGFNGVIPPGFPNDSFMMGVSSGERVSVTPAHSTKGNGGNMVIQNLYVQGVSTESQLFEKVQAAARQRGRDFARVM